MAKPSTWTRIEGEVRGEYRGRRGYNVIERYSAPLGTTFANVEAAFPRFSAYGGMTGTFKPLLEDYTVEDARAPDARDLVTLYWLAPTWRAVLERNPNKARLLASMNEVAVRPKKDLDGKNVWGEVWTKLADGVRGAKFEPISGSGLQHHARTLFRYQVAATSGIVGTVLGLHDTVNQNGMSFGAGPGTLRLAGMHSETVMSEQALTFIDILMAYNVASWNKDTVVQQYEYRVYRMQARNQTTGALIAGIFENVGNWYAIEGAAGKHVAKLHKAEDWSGIDKMIVWQ